MRNPHDEARKPPVLLVPASPTGRRAAAWVGVPRYDAGPGRDTPASSVPHRKDPIAR